VAFPSHFKHTSRTRIVSTQVCTLEFQSGGNCSPVNFQAILDEKNKINTYYVTCYEKTDPIAFFNKEKLLISAHLVALELQFAVLLRQKSEVLASYSS